RFNVANTGKPLKHTAAKKSVSKLPYLPASVETHAAKLMILHEDQAGTLSLKVMQFSVSCVT
ncbi:hypothetical protein ACK1H7_002463, partial [Salmonella enterica]